MADWLIHLLIQIAGTAALLAVTGIAMGKWLRKKIDAALESYITAYVNGQAAIDVRIRNLEKLAEEQARLTRTVETIKDEIAAGAKNRDNRWAFRKDVYVNLIKITGILVQAYTDILTFGWDYEKTDPSTRPALFDKLQGFMSQYNAAMREFDEQAALAPLATADDVLSVISQFNGEAFQVFFRPGDPTFEDVLQRQIKATYAMRTRLQAAGRKELWG